MRLQHAQFLSMISEYIFLLTADRVNRVTNGQRPHRVEETREKERMKTQFQLKRAAFVGFLNSRIARAHINGHESNCVNYCSLTMRCTVTHFAVDEPNI